MTEETEPGKPNPPLTAELFLPPLGRPEEQAEMQISFLTQGVTECLMRSTELFEPPEPEPPPGDSGGYGHTRRKAAPPPRATRRSQELRDAAHLSNATARLIAACAKLRGEFHFTYSQIERVEPGPARRDKAVALPDPVPDDEGDEDDDDFDLLAYDRSFPHGPRRARKEDFGF